MTTERAAAAPRWRRWIVPVVAITLIVCGGAMIGRAEYVATSASFGWVAYAPLSDTTFTPGIGTTGLPLGLALVAAGVAGLAFVAGRRWGARLSPILRPVPWIVGGAAAIVAGAGLEIWRHARTLVGWHDLGPSYSGLSIVATRRQFETWAGVSWLSPAVVAAALLVLGVAALAFAATLAVPTTAKRRPNRS